LNELNEKKMSTINCSQLSLKDLIDHYGRGVDDVSNAVRGMSLSQLRTRSVPGKWSTLEVVCHITDFEVVVAERLRRILAEVEPTLFNGDPDDFERTLSYDARDIEEELALISGIRRQTSRILRSLPENAWQRKGIHNIAGPLTFRQIVESSTSHIPHHVGFIQQKRIALAAQK
jgi:hypothetical protein